MIERSPPPAQYYDRQLAVSPDEDLILWGNCVSVTRYRLSSSTPLSSINPGCGAGGFIYSRSLHVVGFIAKWSDTKSGLYLIDLKSGLNYDFIFLPDAAAAFNKVDIDPTGTFAVVLTNKTVWRVELRLEPSRRSQEMFLRP